MNIFSGPENRCFFQHSVYTKSSKYQHSDRASSPSAISCSPLLSANFTPHTLCKYGWLSNIFATKLCYLLIFRHLPASIPQQWTIPSVCGCLAWIWYEVLDARVQEQPVSYRLATATATTTATTTFFSYLWLWRLWKLK